MRNDFSYQVTAPHFCAAFLLSNMSERVRYAAPILRYMQGWTLAEVQEYCKKKGWTLAQT